MPSKQSPLDPDILFTSWSQSPTPPNSARSFASAIQCAFSLPSSDSYIYHAAPTSLSLSQAQSALNAGGANNLHAWYRDIRTGEPVRDPLPILPIAANSLSSVPYMEEDALSTRPILHMSQVQAENNNQPN